jgi:hypothetical protein
VAADLATDVSADLAVHLALPAAPTDVVLRPPYPLRDGPGKEAALQELVAVIAGADGPMQVWHGPADVTDVVPASAERPAADPATAFTRQLAALARPRRTLLIESASETAATTGLSWPGVIGEGRGQVRLTAGGHGRVLTVTGWPATVHPGWLHPVAERCLAVVLHLRPVPRELASRMLRRRLTALMSTAALDARAGRLRDPGDELAEAATEELREALARGSTRLWHTQLLLALHAPDPAGLDLAEQELRALATGLLTEVTGLRLQQRPGWDACRPGGPALGWPWRLLDTASLAASLPHPTQPPAGVSPAWTTDHPGPTLLGVDPASGVPLLVNRWAAHNATRLVVGTSGAGKSYAAKLELLRQTAAGTAAVIVDPEGEFAAVTDALGGLCLQVGEQPAGLDPVGLACRPGLHPTEGLALLTSWAAALLGGPLTSIDVALLDRALVALRGDRPGGRSGPASPADLLDVVAELAAHRPFAGADLAARLAPASGGTLAGLFAPNPQLLRDPPAVVCFDLRAVPARARPAVMSCVLGWAWTHTVGAAATQPRLVILDEAHLLLDDPAAAELLAQFARRARKYRVGLDVVTQRLSDFLTLPAGQAVLANTATKLLLGCESHERTAVISGLGLTAAEGEWLQPGKAGRGLLLTAADRNPVYIVATDEEHLLASSGPRP